MYLAFIIIGALCILFGIIFLVAPELLIRLNEKSRRVVTTDSFAIRNHRVVGIIFLIIAVVFLYLRLTM
ncbi:MAG: hypothetical protein K9N46_15345 [Candidatus Marinimicrobia bacterium]|nr:hypothetical protein [Candidatus Neomarinimicrobiota bacterium]MCF7830161.1 hypothetical protein [Candidatus Neomarinimicrobiota bacterium]MCF7882105.1 hypothetical protein [Candidatus Neomarinimicrobiota bacterium]